MVKKHAYLLKDDYYESRSVGTKARSNKYCSHCNSIIPKGEPHTVHSFYPEFATYPTHNQCNDDFMASLIANSDTKEGGDVTKEYAKVINDALENDELVYMVRDLKDTKLMAVKNVKELLGIGLKPAKDIVDAIHQIYK